VRFISAEPLLGPLANLNLDGVDWLIAGGEIVHRARPVDATWVAMLRDTRTDADVAFFFKQWGGRTLKAGGRTLDGRTWHDLPSAQLRSTPVNQV
jgi:protein gp37